VAEARMRAEAEAAAAGTSPAADDA